jgi:hypothetical protein
MPFQRTIEPAMNPLPSTVKVNAEPPAAAVDGVRVVSVGVGFPLTVNVSTVEVPPPGAGLYTVTCAVPGAAISDAGIAAASLVAET